jgi:hypothetical protein
MTYTSDDLREPVRVEIQNWSEYNPRKDIKRPYWFALNNRILEDDDFCYLGLEEKLAWIYILCKASQKNTAVAEIYPSRAETVAGIPSIAVRSALEKLSERGAIKILESRTPSVQIRTAPVQAPIEARTEPVRGSVSAPNKSVPTLHNTTIQNKQNKTEEAGTDVAVRPRPDKPTAPEGQKVVEVYCDAWKARYGQNPIILAKNAKQLKDFAKQVGAQKAEDMIAAYMRMPEPWFLTRRHDLTTFLGSLNAVTQFMHTGTVLTAKAMKVVQEKVDEAQGTAPKRRSIDELLAEDEAKRQMLLGGGK